MKRLFRGGDHRFFALAALLALAAGCTFGPRLKTLPLAHGPEGAQVAVTRSPASSEAAQVVRGELLEAREDGLLLLTGSRETATPAAGPASGRRITFVRYRNLREARFGNVAPSLEGGQAPSPRALEKLRRVSRFPQGLGRELLDELLRGCGQAAVEGPWRP